MPRRWLSAVGLLLLMVSACAPTLPLREVGLEYYKARTTLDLDCADLTSRKFQAEVRTAVQDAYARIKADHPGMENYRFEFSRLRSEVVRQDQYTAAVRVYGEVFLFSPEGDLIDRDQVDERINMILEDGRWKVYSGVRL